jgi:inosine/xanthosine triphosphate pyrophosphatase family protein
VAGQPPQVCQAAAAARRVYFTLFSRSALTPSQTFGEMSMEQKAAISHRGHALRLLRDHLLTLA